MVLHLANALPVMAFFQLGSSQLNTFENFLTNAVGGISGMGITAGMMNVSYVILLVGFLWELYGTVLHGGDVRGLGRGAVKYLATALVVQAWPYVFTQVNAAFVHAGQWMTNAGGASNVLDTWMQQLKDLYNQDGSEHMWNLITGEIAGLLDAILIFIAYLLYPIVTLIFGFFYMLMGSVLYIFGPIVVSLLPLGVANRLAKSYVEHIFIWNAWPILYGGLGLLISVIHLNNMSTVLANQNFLGGLQNMEGALMVGLISIVYSCAIAVIPFMAKSIVTGDVGSAARHMLSAATTALAAGVGAAAGVSAGLGAAKASAAGGGNSANVANAANGGVGKNSPAFSNSNQPAPPQPPPTQNANSPASPSQDNSIDSSSGNYSGATDSAAGGTQEPSQPGSGDSSGEKAADSSGVPQTSSERAAQKNLANASMAAEGLRSIDEGEKRNPPAEGASSGSENQIKSESSPSPKEASAKSDNNKSATSGGDLNNAVSQSRQGLSQSSSRSGNGSQGTVARGPNPSHGLSSWAAYHAARIATQGAASTGFAIAGGASAVAGAVKDPSTTAGKVGKSIGTSLGNVVKNANSAKQAISGAVDKVSHPVRTVNNAAQSISNDTKGVVSYMKDRFTEAYNNAKNTDTKGNDKQT